MKNLFKNTYKLMLVFVLILSIFVTTGCDDTPENKELNTSFTDSLKLNESYQGKSFLKNGIGKVELSLNVDGDTAHFRDSSGEYFSARFLMINTPESTGKVDPWGKAASLYTAEKLSTAVEIVIESEKNNAPAVADTTGDRYLSFIWYRPQEGAELRLLNLEIVEECYSRFTGGDEPSKYTDVFQQAHEKSLETGRRVYGEQDPNFDYSYKVNEITIAHLRSNMDEYADNGKKLKMTVRIIRVNGDNIYIEDVEKTDNEGSYDTAGIYLYAGYGKAFSKYPIGTVLTLQCQCVNNSTYGFQLTNPSDVELITYGSPIKDVEYRTYDGKSEVDLSKLEGLVVKFDKVTVTKVGHINDEGAYTIEVKTECGQVINARVDANSTPSLDHDSIEVGSQHVLIGGVSKYIDTYQIMICNQQNQGKKDFALVATE